MEGQCLDGRSPSPRVSGALILWSLQSFYGADTLAAGVCNCAVALNFVVSAFGQRQSLISNGFHNLPQSGHVDALGIVDPERKAAFMADNLSGAVTVHLGQFKRPDEVF